MTSFRTNVKSEVLVWARESVKLTLADASRKLGVSDSTLEKWEAGESSSTIIQLRKMAEVYKRPLAVLYLRRPPTNYDPIKSFRRLVREVDFDLNYSLTVSLERVSRQQEIMLDLLGDDAQEIRDSFPTVNMADDPEATGTKIATWLGLGLRDQQQWARSGALARQLTRLIEPKGILVTQIQGIDLGLMRGCALTDHAIPAIVVNGADSPTAKVFTLVHELVHVLLRASSSAEVVPLTGKWGDYDATERFCNLVTATTLLPREGFSRAVARIRSNPVTEDELREVSLAFGVSRQAALIRMIGLGAETWETYRSFDWTHTERESVTAQPEGAERTNLPLYYPLKVRDLGRLFIEEVRSAYDRHEIGSSELVDYLGVKWENIPKLMKQAGLPT